MTFPAKLRSQGMIRSKLLPLALAVSVVVPTLATTTASAEIKNPKANQAMKKGIRDFARLQGDDVKVASIKVSCAPVPKVGDKQPCTGTFAVSKGGKTARYTLTSKARTTRLSPGAIEYRVNAHASKKVAGLPVHTDLLGFLQ